MEANKTHISLETAKLLKNCGVESEYRWYHLVNDEWYIQEPRYQGVFKNIQGNYPAYTWQEILWENPEKFFGDEDIYGGRHYSLPAFIEYPTYILKFLLRKKYEEADIYFREHCILINKKV